MAQQLDLKQQQKAGLVMMEDQTHDNIIRVSDDTIRCAVGAAVFNIRLLNCENLNASDTG